MDVYDKVWTEYEEGTMEIDYKAKPQMMDPFQHGELKYNPTVGTDASSLLHRAADLIDDRGKERDKPSGERSMKTAVNSFNAMTGHTLTETEGWKFMVFLKLARMEGGSHRLDDYEDAIAYTALMTEAEVECQQ